MVAAYSNTAEGKDMVAAEPKNVPGTKMKTIKEQNTES
jgi:hypothetical protein